MRGRGPLLWVLSGAVLLSALAAWWTVARLRPPAGPPAFDLDGLPSPANVLVASGVPRDGVPAIDEPRWLSASEVDRVNAERRGKLLVPDDRVIGLAVNGDVRAYPLRILQWHEIVNDTVGGEPVAVTYSPLCDSVAVVARRIGGRTVRFGHSGLLWQSNLVLYDRDAEQPSLWSQLAARAIAGPAAGRTLRLLPLSLTTWESWRTEHPDTRVLAPDPRLGREYRRSPYSSYFGSDILRFPVQPLPPGGRLKDRVVTVSAGGEARTFVLPELARRAGASAGEVDEMVGGVPVRIAFDSVLGTAVPRSLDSARPLEAVVVAFRFAWWATGHVGEG